MTRIDWFLIGLGFIGLVLAFWAYLLVRAAADGDRRLQRPRGVVQFPPARRRP